MYLQYFLTFIDEFHNKWLLNFAASTETFGRSDQDNTAPTSTDNSGNSEQSDNTVIFLPSVKAKSKSTSGNF